MSLQTPLKLLSSTIFNSYHLASYIFFSRVDRCQNILAFPGFLKITHTYARAHTHTHTHTHTRARARARTYTNKHRMFHFNLYIEISHNV